VSGSALLLQFLNGLAGANSLFLVAAGLSLIFGVSRIVNFAHGSLYMLGMYVAVWLAPATGFWAAVLLAALIVAATGALVEIGVLRRLYQAPELLQLLATFALVLIVRDFALWAWGPQDMLGPRAPGFGDAVFIAGAAFPRYDLLLIALGPLVFVLLHALLTRTRWGTLVRAATEDREMAAALGVNQRWLFTGIFGLGAGVYVPVPSTLLVWYRTMSSGPSNATLFVYVASTAGVPLGNASVSIRTSSFVFGHRILNGTTDSSGLARFELPNNESVSQDFVGNASYGSLSQSFQGFFEPPAAPALQAPQAVWLNRDDVFAPGETANLRFRLEQDGSGIPHQDLFVYAHTGTDLVLAQPVSTNATGEFAVRFIAPVEPVWLDIAGFIGGAWRSFSQGFIARSHLIATVSSADGRHLSILGRFPSSGGPWIARLGLRSVQGPNEVAGPLTSAGNFGVAALVAGSAGERFTFDVQLPSFLPSGVPVVVSIEAESLRWETGSNGLYMFSQTVIAGTPILRPTNVDPWILLSCLTFLAAIHVVVRPRRRPPTAQDRTSHADIAERQSARARADTGPPRK